MTMGLMTTHWKTRASALIVAHPTARARMALAIVQLVGVVSLATLRLRVLMLAVPQVGVAFRDLAFALQATSAQLARTSFARTIVGATAFATTASAIAKTDGSGSFATASSLRHPHAIHRVPAVDSVSMGNAIVPRASLASIAHRQHLHLLPPRLRFRRLLCPRLRLPLQGSRRQQHPLQCR